MIQWRKRTEREKKNNKTWRTIILTESVTWSPNLQNLSLRSPDRDLSPTKPVSSLAPDDDPTHHAANSCDPPQKKTENRKQKSQEQAHTPRFEAPNREWEQREDAKQQRMKLHVGK